MIFCFLNLDFLWNLWLVIPLVIGRLLVSDDLQYTAISCMVMYLFPWCPLMFLPCVLFLFHKFFGK